MERFGWLAVGRAAVLVSLMLGCYSPKKIGTTSGMDAAASTVGDVAGADGQPVTMDGFGADTTGPTDGPVAADETAPLPACPALPASSGTTITIGPEVGSKLAEMVNVVAARTTILLADGLYRLGGFGLEITQPGVTLRSASGDATKVILDGEYAARWLITISASDVTIAHLTVKRTRDYFVHASPPGGGPDIANLRLYGLRLVDGAQHFVRATADYGGANFVKDARVECSSFQLTDLGRIQVETVGGTACYAGGIKVSGGSGWIVRNNRFAGLACNNGQAADAAIHFSDGGRGALVENNTIINCSRGVAFGFETLDTRETALDPDGGSATDPAYVGHHDGLIRNNVIFGDGPSLETGILLQQASGARVFHNTIFGTAGAVAFGSAIDYRYGNSRVEIRNNLVSRITGGDGAQAVTSNNLQNVPASYFKNAATGDLHLAAGATNAIDKGMTLTDSGMDVDGRPHSAGGGPDIGADETP